MRNIEKWREKCYSAVPAHLYNELRQFRSECPYKQLTIGGKKWNYIACGEGSKPILMLSGATTTGESNWREFPRFIHDYRILSPSYPPVESPEMLVDGILAILDAEGIGRTNIIGASMGSAIAHWFVRKYPDRVGKLILTSIGHPEESSGKAMQKMVRFFSLVPAFYMRRQFISEGTRLSAVFPPEQAALMSAYYRDHYTNCIDKRTILSHFRFGAEVTSNIKLLGLDKPLTSNQPVLIINSDDDESFSPDAQKAFLDTYPNALEHRFESGGHTLSGRREELYSIIIDFLEQ